MPKNSINYLIVKTAHGDNAAFEELYKEMRKPVYYYALHFCGNPSIAEDVMQDTFITIWSKSSSFIPQGDGRSWILSIAKNKTLDILKKSNRTCSLDYIGDVGGEDGIVGLTLTEIAKEKDMKKGTVFWMYNRAVKKLRLESERMGLL